MKAIETHYKGYRFRSRLEARWAVFFDEMEIRWRYETQGFQMPSGEWYLPDFYLLLDEEWEKDSDFGTYFEIKGLNPTLRELNLLQELAVGSREAAYLAVGLPNENSLYVAGAFAPKRRVRTVFADYPEPVSALDQLQMICGRWNFAADQWQVRAAANAARAARFEHGERRH